MKTISINTKNDKKWEEFKNFFSNYPYKLQRNKKADFVLEETTELKCSDENSIGEVISKLDVFENDIKINTFLSTQKVLVHNLKKENWWDGYVYNLNILKSFSELSKKGYKNTPRQLNLSKFIQEFYYKDLNFNFLENNFEENFIVGPENVLNFYMKNIQKIEKKVKISVELKNLIKNGCLMSPGIRKPLNNRLKNYWLPGLNAGIPTVPKDDFIHEITFSLHDVFHQLFPDPLYDGGREYGYIVPRMISEAVTMVMSDYYFINQIYNVFPEYNFEKRKIFKVFKEMENNGASLKDMLMANIYFAIKGDISIFKRFNINKNNLNSFIDKYKVFFIEDYKWTINNFHNIVNKRDKMIELCKINIKNYKTSSYFDTKNLDELVDYFYNEIDKFRKNIIIDQNLTLQSFYKGNYMIFLDYDIYPKLKEFYIESLLNKDFKSCNFYYNLFINKLKSNDIINLDDYYTFQDIYPIFPPTYVFYDRSVKENDHNNQRLEKIYQNIIQQRR